MLRWFRRLRIRWEIRDDIHQAFVTLGWAISAGDACAPRWLGGGMNTLFHSV